MACQLGGPPMSASSYARQSRNGVLRYDEGSAEGSREEAHHRHMRRPILAVGATPSMTDGARPSAPRIFCIPATRAPIVAVLRRGPSAWSHLGKWDLARNA